MTDTELLNALEVLLRKNPYKSVEIYAAENPYIFGDLQTDDDDGFGNTSIGNGLCGAGLRECLEKIIKSKD